MNRVFVLDAKLQPLMPCHPARARQLLDRGQARVYRRVPFTIVLEERVGGDTQPIELRLDPGSRTTGLALVASFARGDRVVWAGELTHRGLQVRADLDRRRALRRGRRGRKTRYRAPRFLNRTRPQGWLPPSLESRVGNCLTWAERLKQRAPLTGIQVETARFDTQALVNPEITGVEYQQGTLAGYEVREYLLEKWGRTCAYCGAKDLPLQVEHIHPRALGGSNRISNLALACEPCNTRKGTQAAQQFLADQPERLRRVLAQAQAPLRDAAAVNATRYAIGRALQGLDLTVRFSSGGRTKFNRTTQGYPKAHWIDAACVGEAGLKVHLHPSQAVLKIEAKGRGIRQVVKSDAHGFPRSAAKRVKRVAGFQTGDLAQLVQPRGKYAGTHAGRIAGIRADGRFDLTLPQGKVTAPASRFTLLQRSDGYAYA